MAKTILFPEIVNVRLPPGTLADLHETARQQGTSAAEVIRQAVRAAVSAKSPQKETAEPLGN